MKDEMSAEVRDGATTNLQALVLQHWKQSNLSVKILLLGNLCDGEEDMREDQETSSPNNQKKAAFKANQNFLSRLQYSYILFRYTLINNFLTIRISLLENSTKKPSEVEQYLEEKEKELDVLERAWRLQKRFWRYKKPTVAQVWATRWIAMPIAYLFPSDRREEWLGDLYEGNLQLLNQRYPRWLINLINVGRTVVLVVSALSIKVSDLVSSAFRGRIK
jgi:hypothetical protein